MRRLPLLLLLFVPLLVWAADETSPTPDPAARFLGTWAGPANVYDDYYAIKPTNAKLVIKRSTANPEYFVVELTLFGDKLSRFTQCRLVSAGEMRVADEVMVDARRVKVEGVLKSRNGHLIDEGHIRFFVETDGQFRPYYAVKLAAKREAQPSPTPTPEASP